MYILIGGAALNDAFKLTYLKFQQNLITTAVEMVLMSCAGDERKVAGVKSGVSAGVG